MATKTGLWVNPNTWGKQLLVQWNQGGCAYVDSVITNICEMRFGAFNSYNPVLRIDEGGGISNVNIQVGGFQTSSSNQDTKGTGARLHINGGERVIGNSNYGFDGLTGLNIGITDSDHGFRSDERNRARLRRVVPVRRSSGIYGHRQMRRIKETTK